MSFKYKLTLLGSAIAAMATLQAAPACAQGAGDNDIVVTGSLVVRNGNQAPTPVTVVDAATLQQSAPTNIPDGLNQLPQFSGSRSESQNNQTGTAISPNAGNYLNLRNLGIVRSLILLDGQRIPPTSFEGTVDTNMLPQALVQRVDVVTAGASATYGSDALTGVVNFILDKRFTGLKGSVQKGISQEGDNGNYRVSFAGGMPLFNDRGHVLFSAEHYQSNGINNRADRPYMALGAIAFGNGTTIPYDLRYGARVANSTFGGLFTTGPVGISFQKFEPDGRLTPFDRGTATIAQVQLGGDGSETVLGSLIGRVRTDQLFGRFQYDITDNITGWVQATFAESRNAYAHVGADSRFANMTIFSGNAFLRPEIQQILTTNNTASVTFSRHSVESGQKIVNSLNDNISVFAGLEGKLWSDWTWKTTFAGGRSILRMEHTRNPENTRLTAALDAVDEGQFRTGVKNGNIVCRVTLTNPGTFQGCVPVNFFGVGAPSQSALEYIYGQNSQYQVHNDLYDVAAQATGTIWELPAGPITGAVGVEWRTQSLDMESNADPAVALDTAGLRGFPAAQGRFGNTNQGVAVGSQDVSEAFGEVQVPLLKDLPLISALDFNGAFRWTEYSTSGQVETWKAGLSYTPFSDLRVRATVSRDIRAPTLNELFAGAALSAGTFTDIHTQLTGVATTITSGNSALVPEVGKTKTIGFVYQPSWLSGFTASVDYYDIEITGAISRRTNTQINQDCEDSGGVSPSCALIIRPNPFSDRSAANIVQRVQVQPQNQAQTYTHGVDADFGYRLPLDRFFEGSDAQLTFRLLVNYAPTLKNRETATAAPVEQAGLQANNNPIWRTTASVNYKSGPLGVNLQQRRVGDVIRDNRPNQFYVQNDIAAVYYYNLAASYEFEVASKTFEAFANVNNLLNEEPPLIPRTDQPGLTYPTNQSLYDVVGRYYTAGVRFKF
jgi:outer membrane receptor protein involved in Fe transport